MVSPEFLCVFLIIIRFINSYFLGETLLVINVLKIKVTRKEAPFLKILYFDFFRTPSELFSFVKHIIIYTWLDYK